MSHRPFLRTGCAGAVLALSIGSAQASVLTLSRSTDTQAIVRNAVNGGATLNSLDSPQDRLLIGSGTVAADPAHDLVYVAANPDPAGASPPATGSLIIGSYSAAPAPALSLAAPAGYYFAAVVFDAPRSRLVGALADRTGAQVTQLFTADTANGAALGPINVVDSASGCCRLASGVAAWRESTQELFLVGRRTGDTEDQLLRFDLASRVALPDAYPIAGESVAALSVNIHDYSLYGVARTAMNVTHLVRITYATPGNAATLSAIGSTPAACCYVALGAATIDTDDSGRALFALTQDAQTPTTMQLTRFDLSSGDNVVVNADVEGYALWTDSAASLDRIFADGFE